MFQRRAERHPLGRLIAEAHDRQGSVSVYENAGLRYLTFGNTVEQSCLDPARPHQLRHVYTQAMMLGLLLRPDAGRALLLGLGGGSLVHALQHVRPRMRIDAVEQRQAVIELAQSHFSLQQQPRLRLHHSEAETFVATDRQRYALLMLDLYLADGVHPAQSEIAFLTDCHARLDEYGILLANHWCSEFRDSRQAHQAMQTVFGERVLYLHVQGGNTIAFGFAGELPRLRRNEFFAQAQQLGLSLNIPLQKLARNFWRQNAEPLQIGRFQQTRQ
jgi:spermidine synthase